MNPVLSPVELALTHYQLHPRAKEASSARYEDLWKALHEGSRYFCPLLGINLIKRTKGFELDLAN